MTNTEPAASTDPVTDLHRPGSGGQPPVDAAVAAADAAALAAGVRIRELAELAELEKVYLLYDGIWRPDPKNPPITTELLRAFTKAGNYVAGAFDGGELVGACVGFFGAPAGKEMHSHIAGVSGAALGRSTGFALKLHQRAWAMQRGVSAISWTFDPLVCRNAYFNLVKLGAVAAEYLPNFYGDMHDSINAGDATDRLLVRWQLNDPTVAAACAGEPNPADVKTEQATGAVIALDRSGDGRPVSGTVDGHTILIAVPTDIETLRSVDPAGARQWRAAVREVLATAMASGGRVTGFDKAGWYVVTRRSP